MYITGTNLYPDMHELLPQFISLEMYKQEKYEFLWIFFLLSNAQAYKIATKYMARWIVSCSQKSRYEYHSHEATYYSDHESANCMSLLAKAGPLPFL